MKYAEPKIKINFFANSVTAAEGAPQNNSLLPDVAKREIKISLQFKELIKYK